MSVYCKNAHASSPSILAKGQVPSLPRDGPLYLFMSDNGSPRWNSAAMICSICTYIILWQDLCTTVNATGPQFGPSL